MPLDDSEMHNEFPSTLYNIELNPPPAAWEKIRSTLDAPAEQPTIATRKVVPLWRYAAAAAVIGLIAFASLQLFKKTSSKDGIAKEQISQPALNLPDPGERDTSGAGVEDARDEAVLRANEQTVARLDTYRKTQRRVTTTDNYISERIYFPSSGLRKDDLNSYPDVHDEATGSSAIAHQDITGNNNKRYIMLMTPDGNIIRMSRKLSDLVCCVSGQEQDDDCKSQLKIWRDKMASSVAPSSGNFMDILNLVNTLQNNN